MNVMTQNESNNVFQTEKTGVTSKVKGTYQFLIENSCMVNKNNNLWDVFEQKRYAYL